MKEDSRELHIFQKPILSQNHYGTSLNVWVEEYRIQVYFLDMKYKRVNNVWKKMCEIKSFVVKNVDHWDVVWMNTSLEVYREIMYLIYKFLENFAICNKFLSVFEGKEPSLD